MDIRELAEERDRLLERRLDIIVPDLMAEHGFDAWVITSREYNEDPVGRTMLPATWLDTARRRTILVFKEGGLARGAVARYPVGPFPGVWDPAAEPNQWASLATFLEDVTGPVGIDISSTHALADGLSATERDAMREALEGHEVVSAEKLAIGWLERRLPEERAALTEACAIAHGFLRRALSTEVITPGETTTQDVAWWLAQTSHDSGHRIWFHPGVTVQRAGDIPASPADGIIDRVIEPGDLVHVDFGIIRDGYHTDQQQHGYVLLPDDIAAPDSLVGGMAQANTLQEILMDEMRPGRSGNAVLASSLSRGRDVGIRPVIYTHPIGLHGHAAGSTIGLWDAQDGVPGEGDYPIGEDTAWSIELAVEITIPEWDGQEGRIMVEENAFLEDGEVTFLDGRQEQIWLVG